MKIKAQCALALMLGLIIWLCTTLHAEETSPTYQGIADDERRSGLTFQSEQIRQMQADPVGNPGQLWVLHGENMWGTPVSDGGRSCRSCHGDAARSMRGVATGYPAVDKVSGNLFNLEARINNCRTAYQKQPSLNYETDELLALTSYVAYQSQGLPMNVAIDGEARAFLERGREFYYTRQGQMNLACNHCHENNYGRRLRGDHLSQGHSNGYPSYRLEWQTLGSLHRRLRACSSGVRAIMYEYGSPEYLSLELYLAWRARSLLIETPAVRR